MLISCIARRQVSQTIDFALDGHGHYGMELGCCHDGLLVLDY